MKSPIMKSSFILSVFAFVIIIVSSAASIDWDAVSTAISKCQSASSTKDSSALQKCTRDLVRTLPKEKIYALMLDWKHASVAAGVLTYVDGNIFSLSLLPYYDRIKNDEHLLYNVDDVSDFEGLALITNKNSISAYQSNTKYFIHRKRFSLPEGVVRMYFPGTQTSTDLKSTESQCAKFSRLKDDIISDYEDVNSDGLMVIGQDLFCLQELNTVADYVWLIEVGETYDHYGNKLHYVVKAERKKVSELKNLPQQVFQKSSGSQ
uniref:Protein p30 n=1 Tax=Phalaenopsis equestris Jingman-related virus TaxID=2937974 RepID=A0AAT9JAK4_9FLAV